MRNIFVFAALLASAAFAAPAPDAAASLGQGVASGLMPAFIAVFKPLFSLFAGFALFCGFVLVVKNFIRQGIQSAKDKRAFDRWRGRQEFSRRRAELERQSRQLRRSGDFFRGWKRM